MTHAEIIRGYKNLLKGGRHSDDYGLSDRQIAFYIDNYRAKLLREQAAKGATLDDNLYQSLGRIELIQADRNFECDTRYCILRTKEELPKVITATNGKLVRYLGSLSGNQPFERTTRLKAAYDSYARWTGKEPKYFESGGHLFVIAPKLQVLRYITLEAVFESPLKAREFLDGQCSGEGEDCPKGLDYEYPVDRAFVDTIYKLITDGEIRLLLNGQEDQTNDATSN